MTPMRCTGQQMNIGGRKGTTQQLGFIGLNQESETQNFPLTSNKIFHVYKDLWKREQRDALADFGP